MPLPRDRSRHLHPAHRRLAACKPTMRQSLMTDALGWLSSRQEHDEDLIVHSSNGSQFTSCESLSGLALPQAGAAQEPRVTPWQKASCQPSQNAIRGKRGSILSSRPSSTSACATHTENRSLKVVHEGRIRRLAPLEALARYNKNVTRKFAIN